MNKVSYFGKTLSALAALLFAAVPVYAATFVKDVMLIGGNESETTALKTSYADQGWTAIDSDLNAGADGDYIYMHAPAAHSPLGLTVNGLDIAYASGTGWTFDGATVSLSGAGPFVLSTDGANFTSNVAVVAQADCAVTFSNLEVFAGNHAGLSPFTVAPGVSVALTLEGNTVLTAGSGAAAITVVSNATGVASLTIDADASDTFHTLGATGGNQGAGIGGGDGEACGSVTILGGLLTVEGGANAAGIGGGRNGAGGAVTISGGRLNVKSAGSYAFVGGRLKTTNGGAAIGGGYQGPGGMTAISGGTMSLTGVGDGAAIGPGKDGAGGTTAITGGSILARVGAVEPPPSNGVAQVWPVSVTGLADSAAPSLPWLPATYGTNDFVAVGGEVCVWLPSGDYAYGEAESDGAGGMRRHAVLVDAEGTVTFDGWAMVSPLSSLTITGFTLDPDGTATIAFEGDGDLASVANSLSVEVSATPDFTTLLVPASTNLTTSGATGSFTVGKPEGDHSALFYRVQER